MGEEEEDTKALEFIATIFSGYTQHCSSFISNQDICHHWQNSLSFLNVFSSDTTSGPTSVVNVYWCLPLPWLHFFIPPMREGCVVCVCFTLSSNAQIYRLKLLTGHECLNKTGLFLCKPLSILYKQSKTLSKQLQINARISMTSKYSILLYCCIIEENPLNINQGADIV